MIKKKNLTCCIFLLMVMLSACQTTEVNRNEMTMQNDTVQTTDVQALTEERLKWLIDENIYCNLYVFGMHSLPREAEPIEYEGRKVYLVDTDSFADFASFEEYVCSVYCEEMAKLYLYKKPYEDAPQYVNIDGNLYVDISREGGSGYFVDWSEYSFEIKNQNEERCEFTVTATVEWPADIPVKEPYTVECAAVFENGRWLLEQMIY